MNDERKTEKILAEADKQPPTPSQGGTSGGGMQAEIGSRDEEKNALGGDSTPTSVHKSDRPNDGDASSEPMKDGSSNADHSRRNPGRDPRD